MEPIHPMRCVSCLATAFTLALVGLSSPPSLAAAQLAASNSSVSAQQPAETPAGVVRLNLEQFEHLMQEGNVVLVDVRAYRAYDYAHLPDAESIPLDELERAIDRLRATNARIVFYCDGPAGVKSGRAAALLRQRGFAHIYCLDGGFERWVASGRVVVVQPSDS